MLFSPDNAHLLEEATELLTALHNAGHEAYFAGGAVRDGIMGRPLSDIDIATSALPDEIEQLFEKTLAIGQVKRQLQK